MVKLTRNSYKRKIILFGVLIFASIALISTGFAAWIMSTNANKDTPGNVTVGQVTDSSLKIEELALSKTTLMLEPKESDNTGRVRNDGTNFESLETVVTAKISPTVYIKEVVVKFVVPLGVKKAADEGYIVLPEFACLEEEVATFAKGKTYVLTSTDKDQAKYALSEKIEIKWGIKFNNQNPGVYYDDDPAGKLDSDATVKKTLEDFRALVYGYFEALNAAGTDQAARDAVIKAHENDTLAFKVIVEAHAN